MRHKQAAAERPANSAGRWVTADTYAAQHALAVQTLANWRCEDKKLGRTSARPGFPRYARWGGAVRYWLPLEEQPLEAA